MPLPKNPIVKSDQITADCETLAMIAAGLDRLEATWVDTQKIVHARTRGYFTPDEDDAVRQMLLSYRNYRIGLYEIIHRCTGYASIKDPLLQLQTFLIGFAAALTLYSKSLKLIQTYEREPLVRAKLNESEEKFGLGEGFFEEVLAAYSSPKNYWRLLKASAFWRTHQRAAKRMGLLDEDYAQSLTSTIRRQRKAIPRRLLQVLAQRARYDLRLFCATALNPFRRTGYAFKSVIGTAFAGARVTLNYKPALTREILQTLRTKLQPGDILLVRADEKLTAAILPGFWSHAAIYLGTKQEFAEAGLELDARRAAIFDRHGADTPIVIEAIAPKLTTSPLDKSLFGDHAVALRPNVPLDLLECALREAFAHLGKAYDFEFDFNVTSRIVCTELVYRAFHRKGDIQFNLVKRLGRFTLTGNDIVHYALDNVNTGNPLRPVALVLKRGPQACFIPDDQIVPALETIRAGKSPNDVSIAAPALLAS
ncbi:MAG: YiiX/YebB-like N1pC/P60 family cysteine hydrolase [Limisphaerales bacterium]